MEARFSSLDLEGNCAFLEHILLLGDVVHDELCGSTHLVVLKWLLLLGMPPGFEQDLAADPLQLLTCEDLILEREANLA